MNRRDTILVAVLVNVGLVVVLFVCGIKPATPIELAKNSEKESIIEPKVEEDSATSIDQVDQILSKYIEQEQPKVVEPVAIEKVAEIIEPKKEVKSQKKAEEYKEVIVKQGDMLEKIARANKTKVEDIMRLNGLASTRLQIGQILRVPVNGSVSAINKLEKTNVEPKYYVVKNGENPWTIAIKNKIRVEELLRLNNLDEAKAKRLKPGDRLRVK